jgi:ParB family chromosome partitioning protein
MVLIDAIDLGDRMRSVDEDEAREISESIALNGLDNAISVRVAPDDPGRFILVSGGHRIRAHKMLGLDYIRADIVEVDENTAKSIERDENFFRSGLTAAQAAIAAGSFLDEWLAKMRNHWSQGDKRWQRAFLAEIGAEFK